MPRCRNVRSLSSGFFCAADDERRLLHVDLELVLVKAGDRHRNAVLVVAETLDVVGRVAVDVVAADAVQKLGKPVEADGRTIEGGKIELSHDISS